MSENTLNPYASPASAGRLVEPASAAAAGADWKAIAWRWERLRPLYNAVLLLEGLTGLLFLLGDVDWRDAVVGVVVYGIAANACYSFGPLAEMYANWFVDAIGEKFLPVACSWWVRSWWFTAVLFGAGLMFSLVLTALFALAFSFTAMLPNQN